MTTPLQNLELADLSIQSAIGHLVTAAEALPTETDEHVVGRESAKAIAVRLRRESGELYALRSYLTPSLSALLEESLGAEPAENCS